MARHATFDSCCDDGACARGLRKETDPQHSPKEQANAEEQAIPLAKKSSSSTGAGVL